MTRQLDALREVKQAKRDADVLLALEGGIVDAVSRAGGVLTGLNIRLGGADVLITVKALVAGKAQIAFVGGGDLPGCLRKVVREANGDRLRWKADRFAKE